MMHLALIVDMSSMLEEGAVSQLSQELVSDLRLTLEGHFLHCPNLKICKAISSN
jgi:hypothetical protein